MIEPFASWQRLISAGAEMAQTNLRAVEMLVASHDVIRRRSEMIGVALARPGSADTNELMRVVPEKADALTRAGIAVAGDIWAAQSALLGELQHLSGMMLRGRLPTVAELRNLGTRNLAFALGTTEGAVRASGHALDPIHKRVTSNARRLRAKAAA